MGSWSWIMLSVRPSEPSSWPYIMSASPKDMPRMICMAEKQSHPHLLEACFEGSNPYVRHCCCD